MHGWGFLGSAASIPGTPAAVNPINPAVSNGVNPVTLSAGVTGQRNYPADLVFYNSNVTGTGVHIVSLYDGATFLQSFPVAPGEGVRYVGSSFIRTSLGNALNFKLDAAGAGNDVTVTGTVNQG